MHCNVVYVSNSRFFYRNYRVKGKWVFGGCCVEREGVIIVTSDYVVDSGSEQGARASFNTKHASIKLEPF